MVKQKKSTSVSEKERKVDEEPKWEDRLQRSSMVKDGLSVDAANNANVVPVIASSESVAMVTKRTRSRPQPTVASKDPKTTTENDTPTAEVELQLPDVAQCQPPVAVHQIATRSTTGRLAKRPKQEIPSKKIPPKKQAKEVHQVVAEGGNVEPARSRRPWELWGTDDTNLFFEALFEHGKDFDAIQTFMAQRHKKRSDSESAAKTKDQIRHFYYRTSHKISSHIKLSSAADDSRKQALELYGLVCYGEIRRKSLLKVNKIWSRLNELLTQGYLYGKTLRTGCELFQSVTTERRTCRIFCIIVVGSTMIRVRGKNLRIKVPQCRALKRLYNVEEQRDDSKLKLPEKVTLKMHPRTNAAWSHVQMLSQNPRLLINVQPDQHLSAIFDYLNRKWRLECLQMKEALGEKVVDPLELRLHVSSDYTLTPISISRSNSQPKLDFSFENFLENIKNSVPALSTSVSPPNKRTLKIVASRTEDQSPKNRSVTETVKTSTNSSATNEEDQLRLLPQPVQLSSTNSPVSQGTGINGNSTVAVAMETDDNACDLNTTAAFCPGSGNLQSEAPCVFFDTLGADVSVCSTAEGKDSVSIMGNGILNSPHQPSSETATTSTAPTVLSTVATTLSTASMMPLAVTTFSGAATTSVVASSLLGGTSSIAAAPSSAGVKTSSVATMLSSVATITSSVTMATMSAAAACSSAAAVSTCDSLLVNRLSGPITRFLAEEVTVAELFIMAGRPKELILEYDWTRTCSSSASVAAEQSVSVGTALQHLTNVALNEFAGFSRTAASGRLGAMSPPTTALGFKMDANSIGTKGPTRNPRVRQNPSVSRTRKDSISKAPDASLDQSANYPWSNASSLVTPFDATNILSTPSLYTFSTPVSSVLSTISTPVTMVTYSSAAAGDGNSPKTLMTPTSEGVFRVPKSLPPKLQAKNTDGRTIIDKKILDGLGIYHSKRSELFMPRKARARNSRKPLVIQRTLLPKSQLQTSQIVTLTLVPGVSSAQTGSFLPVACSAALSSQLQLTPAAMAPVTMKPTTAISSTQQNVIKMAPTELKSTGIRRIVPVPVPADTVAVFPAVDRLISCSQNEVVMSTVPNGADQNLTTSSLISESSLPTAITGIDAFLELSESQDAISVQQGMTQSLAPTLPPSFLPSLGDSNLSIPSLLDMSLPEGTDSSDRFLDLDLMNSNSSFPGFLNTVEEKNQSSNLTLPNDDSLLNSVKHLPGLTGNEAWFNNEESLSNLLPNFASVKKDLDKSLALTAAVSIRTTSSLIHSNVFINDNSRESSMFSSLNTMEVNFQSAMDEENTFEIGSNFKQVVEQQSSDPYNQLRTMTSESSSYIRNT